MAEKEESGFKFVKISDATHAKLGEFGKKSETYEDIIIRLLDDAKKESGA